MSIIKRTSESVLRLINYFILALKNICHLRHLKLKPDIYVLQYFVQSRTVRYEKTRFLLSIHCTASQDKNNLNMDGEIGNCRMIFFRGWWSFESLKIFFWLSDSILWSCIFLKDALLIYKIQLRNKAYWISYLHYCCLQISFGVYEDKFKKGKHFLCTWIFLWFFFIGLDCEQNYLNIKPYQRRRTLKIFLINKNVYNPR